MTGPSNVVLDASVFNKLYLEESDSSEAVSLVKHLVQNDFQLVAPSILPLEICKTALHFEVPLDLPLQIIEAHKSAGMKIVEPDRRVWNHAEEIAKSGNSKSGHPSLEDSLYHALAIAVDGIFISADRRHFAKSKQFGNICLFSEWRSLVSA